MRRVVWSLLGPACALVLLLVVYRTVLFGGEQFAFRDAAHFYYPLYLRIQQEWQAGRWPLWDQWQNGGQPLLGSPVTAVLYPGKLIYAVFPYAWAVRLYIVAHTVLAFAGMVALGRSLGISGAGSMLAGLSYAFGAPVLFQYSNVIFLVGAAWLPWGLRAVDRFLRLGRGAGLCELAAVLALQVLGGDPQAAYLTILCGAGYAALLTLRDREWPWLSRRTVALVVGAALVLWVVIPLAWAHWQLSVPGWFGMFWLPSMTAWVIAGGWLAWRWYEGKASALAPRLAGILGAAALAGAIAAVQLLPVVEFTAASGRTSSIDSSTATKFSVEPFRLAELVWPWIFGRTMPENRAWVQLVPPAMDRQLWTPSLYVGGLVLVLGVGAARIRGAPAWRVWLTGIAALSVIASFGRFGGPLWWARWIAGDERAFGPQNPIFVAGRPDLYPHDGTGTLYTLLGALFPGFGLFRYPAKLLTLGIASLAVLAGAGWDEATAGRTKWLARSSAVGLIVSIALLGLAFGLRGWVVAPMTKRLYIDSYSGPPDAAGAWGETQRALAHGALVFAAGVVLARWAARSPQRAGAAVLMVLAVDLGVANSRLVWTAPQAEFDDVPEVARRIEEAEREHPSPGPFRVYRIASWLPSRFMNDRSPDRLRELLAWERGTLESLHPLPLGFELSYSPTGFEVNDYVEFYRFGRVPVPAETAAALKLAPGDPVFYHVRRTFDVWNVRYFVLPALATDWSDDTRGIAALLSNSEAIYPGAGLAEDKTKLGQWAVDQDWQVLRNKTVYPRAWLVHAAKVYPSPPPTKTITRIVGELLYQNDAIWSVRGRPVFDPRLVAWIETDDREALRGFIAPVAVEKGETVTVTRHDPQQVELGARLTHPGIVVLADAYYPGWHLTIDGVPAPILRVNRMMRGAAVTAGQHTLVYTYDPLSVRVGLTVTPIGLAALGALGVGIFWRSRRDRVVAARSGAG